MHNTDCTFCKIINKELPSTVRFENDKWIAFNDLHGTAPEHILLIPKQHIESLGDVDINDVNFHGEFLQTGRTIANEVGIGDNYKLFINVGKQVQAVHHIHLHIMGGWKKEKNVLGMDKGSVDLINS